MRTIAVMNQKGGVGKSTTTMNVAHALALSGKHVMVLDMDPQGHLAAGLGVTGRANSGLDEVLIDHAPISNILLEARENLRLAPAGSRLAEFETVSSGGAKRGWKLAEALPPAINGEAYILIDCPPSAGLLAMNALFAAQEVLIPVSGDYLAMHGLSRFIQILSHIDESLERETRIWIAITRFQERRRLAREVRDKLVQHFPGSVLVTAIRETVAIAESPGFGQTIFEYQKSGNGADDYRALATDLDMERTL